MSENSTHDEWQAQATARAVAAVKKILEGVGGRRPISGLSDHDLAFVVVAAVTAWVGTRAEQATQDGLRDGESLIMRTRSYDADIYDAGAVAAILPELAETPGLDWGKPLSEWPRDKVVALVMRAHALAQKAIAARDDGGRPILGGPAYPGEPNEDCPF